MEYIDVYENCQIIFHHVLFFFLLFSSMFFASSPSFSLSLSRPSLLCIHTKFGTCAKEIHPTRSCTGYFLDDHFFRHFSFRFHFGYAIFGFRTIPSAIFVPFSVSRSRCMAVASAQPFEIRVYQRGQECVASLSKIRPQFYEHTTFETPHTLTCIHIDREKVLNTFIYGLDHILCCMRSFNRVL